jgi:hypothetical protein
MAGPRSIDYPPWVALAKTGMLAVRAVPLVLGLGSALVSDGLTGGRFPQFVFIQLSEIARAALTGELPFSLEGASLGLIAIMLVMVGGYISAACGSFFAGIALPMELRAILRLARRTIGAVLLPTGACCLLGVLPMAAGLCWQAGGWWQPMAYVLALPAMICGLVLLVLGPVTLFAWPLMVAAAAIEQTDEFGAFSRAINYTTGQPLRLLSYALPMIGLIGGSYLMSLRLIDWLVAVSSGFGMLSYVVDGLLISWGWCCMGTIYLLLRQAEDGLPLDAIAQPVLKDFPDHLPVVGLKRTAG